jgi:hypothetical protein
VNNKNLYILAVLLVLTALALSGYKKLILHYPLQPHAQTDVWNVEVRVRFDAKEVPVKLTMMLPPQGNGTHTIYDEQFVSHGYGMSSRKDKASDNRKVFWSVREAKGEQVLYYQATVRQANQSRVTRTHVSATPAPVAIEFTEAQLIAADALLTEVRSRSADSETFIIELLNRLNEPYTGIESDAEVAALLGKKPDLTRKLNIAVQVLALAKFPARIANGIKLQQLVRNANIQQWLEVYYLERWHAYDPVTVEPKIPEDYLTWWWGSEGFVKLTGGENINTRISVSLSKEDALSGITQQIGKNSLITEFSLLSLPIETQVIYHVILPIPLAVLLLVLLRNVVGIKTFGTFMPVLIALAFRETQLLWGVFMFSFIVAIGLITRFYLDRLKLLLVARLASILIIVVILITALSILSHKLGLYRGLSVTLFPMVILTMTIEHMTIVWEERGAQLALQQGLGSLLVAVLAYPLLSMAFIQNFLFIYTETLLIILAMTLLLGRYTGYRLTELWRFKALAREAVKDAAKDTTSGKH